MEAAQFWERGAETPGMYCLIFCVDARVKAPNNGSNHDALPIQKRRSSKGAREAQPVRVRVRHAIIPHRVGTAHARQGLSMD
jgi:hypothetical protein